MTFIAVKDDLSAQASMAFRRQPPSDFSFGNGAIVGHGDFGTEVVGESAYQSQIEYLAGGRTYDGVQELRQAALILENSNPYDPQAVRIDVAGYAVGYLNRDDARVYRQRLSGAGYASAAIFTCNALIVGGWDRGRGDVGYFGVRLDLPLYAAEGRSTKRHSISVSEAPRSRLPLVLLVAFIIGGVVHFLTRNRPEAPVREAKNAPSTSLRKAHSAKSTSPPTDAPSPATHATSSTIAHDNLHAKHLSVERDWHLLNGRTLRGTLKSWAPTKVVIVQADGEEFVTSSHDLSATDRAWFEEAMRKSHL